MWNTHLNKSPFWEIIILKQRCLLNPSLMVQVRSREATPSSPSDEILGEMEVMRQTHFLPVILEIMKTWFEKAG